MFSPFVRLLKPLRCVPAVAFVAFCLTNVTQAGTVDIQPGDNIPSIVSSSPAGTTFIIYPGTYRLTETIAPKNNDSFIGQTACAPPTTSCPAIISGSRVISGPSASLEGSSYKSTGQTQQGAIYIASARCQPGWEGCIYPEDLFFDGVPLKHLNSGSMPTIATGQWWFDYPNNAIYFHDNPQGHVVETSIVPAAFSSWANNVTISNLTIKEFAAPSLMAAIGIPGNTSTTEGLNWTISHCEILLNHSSGIRTAGLGWQVLNNYIHNNGEIGINGGTPGYTNSDGIVISGNTISNNNYAHFLAGYMSGGIKVSNTTGVVVRGNTITNNDGAGIHFDMDVHSVLVDGNTVMGNASGGGIPYEVSLSGATIRNNIVLRNGVNLSSEPVTSNTSITSYDSVGVNAYCNVIEIPNAQWANGWTVMNGQRTDNSAPSSGNYFHHNTVIWDAGAKGYVGFSQNAPSSQPNFFSGNTPPDHNSYHIPNTSLTNFIYDNNNTAKNTRLTFAQYQAKGADLHSTIDTNYNVGYPTVKITSPADASTVSVPVTISANASDTHGISKVEFYVDWNLESTVTSAPFNFGWTNGTTGQHTIAAMAYSDAGVRSCYAVTVTKK